MPIEVRIVRIEQDYVVAESLSSAVSGEINILYNDLFLDTEFIEKYSALVQSGGSIIRVGDHIHIKRRFDGSWTRRELKKFGKEVTVGSLVKGYVTGFTENEMMVNIEQGLAAQIPLEQMNLYLQQRINLPEGCEHLPLGARIGIGDPIAGYVVNADSSRIEIDIVLHLKELENGHIDKSRLLFVDLHKQKQQGKNQEVKHKESQIEIVPCPKAVKRVMVIDDESTWAERKLKPWLEAADAEVFIITEDFWESALSEAYKLKPDLIIVDQYLVKTDESLIYGSEILLDLIRPNAHWNLILISRIPLRIHVPNSVWGSVCKSNDMSELAETIKCIQQGLSPRDIKKKQTVEEYVARRNQKETLGQIQSLTVRCRDVLRAKVVCVFAYNILQDRAFWKYGTDLADVFENYKSNMHKSQIRDLAFCSDDQAIVQFPEPRLWSVSWYWFMQILYFEWAIGKRLKTPDRDEVWSLFAFFNSKPKASNSVIREKFETFTTAIEDACWHLHNEETAEDNLKLKRDGECLHDLAHEFVSPTATIRETTDEVLKQISKNSYSLSEITQFFTDINDRTSDIEMLAQHLLRKENINPQEINILNLLKDIVRQYHPYKPESFWKGIRLNTPIVVPKGLTIIGVRPILRSVIDNIVRNALQAIQRTISLRTMGHPKTQYGEIVIEARLQGESAKWLEILIHDTGIGISKFTRDRMWDRNFSSTIRGTGLGMGICQMELATIGGHLEIKETSMYVGTTIGIRLPTKHETHISKV